MAASFNFELVSPERLLLSATVSEVVIPGSDGEMTVMAEHAPVMTTIRPGVLSVKEENGQSHKFVVFGGFADIVPSGCTLLAESALSLGDFNKEILTKRIDLAKADLEHAHGDENKTRLAQLVADLGALSPLAA
jgi:F-type H+-transporting ATPase subunit epsilon